MNCKFQRALTPMLSAASSFFPCYCCTYFSCDKAPHCDFERVQKSIKRERHNSVPGATISHSFIFDMAKEKRERKMLDFYPLLIVTNSIEQFLPPSYFFLLYSIHAKHNCFFPSDVIEYSIRYLFLMSTHFFALSVDLPC